MYFTESMRKNQLYTPKTMRKDVLYAYYEKNVFILFVNSKNILNLVRCKSVESKSDFTRLNPNKCEPSFQSV